MDKKQRFVSLTLLGSQSPTSGGSLTWILVRAGIEACSSGSSWGATATVREVGEMSHNSYVLWTFHSAPPSKSSLIKDLINTDILSGPDMHLWWSSMPKTFGNRWVKENNIQHCLISPSLRISKKVQSLIYQVPSDFVVDIGPQSTYSQTVSGGFRLWNTSGNIQLQELNLIPFISYVYFYDIPGWSDFGE